MPLSNEAVSARLDALNSEFWQGIRFDAEVDPAEEKVLLAVLNQTYTDGFDRILNAGMEGGSIVGQAVDGNRVFSFTVDEKSTSYVPVRGDSGELDEDEAELLYLDRADSMRMDGESEIYTAAWLSQTYRYDAAKAGAKKRNCTKGTPCGGSCIPGGRKCRKANSPAAAEAVTALKSKMGGKMSKSSLSKEKKNEILNRNITTRPNSRMPRAKEKINKTITQRGSQSESQRRQELATRVKNKNRARRAAETRRANRESPSEVS